MSIIERSNKTAADLASPMDVGVMDPGAAPAAKPEAPRLFHCPVDGSGSLTRGSDGTVTCGFCSNSFKIVLAPQHPAMPMTIDGQPFTPEGQPPITGQPLEMGNATPAAVPPPAGGGGTLQGFRVDTGSEGGSASIQNFRTSMLITASGEALPYNSYLAHLAVRHAEDPQGVIEQIRTANRGR